jgi:hypothetical protein
MIGDPLAVVSLLGLTMIGTAGLLALLPVGTCRECNHCQLEKLSREKSRDLEGDRALAAAFCAVCGHHHRADEEHRF